MFFHTSKIALGFVFLFILLFSGNADAKKKATVAVVQDGPAPLHEFLLELTKTELLEVTKDEFDITLDTSPQFNANWDLSKTEEVLKNALRDAKIDYILTLGLEVTFAASSANLTLNKPVIAGILYRSDRFFNFPLNQNKKSSKKNFSFVMIEEGISKDLMAFKRMMDFKTLHIFRDIRYGDSLNQILDQELVKIQNEFKVKIYFIDISAQADNPQKIIAAVPANAEAIYLTVLPRLSPKNRSVLVQALTARKIPTFSMLGHHDVETGALAGLTPKLAQRLSRRLALNIQQLLMGFPTSDLTVFLPFQEQLLINMETAEKLDYHPDFKILRDAQLYKERDTSQNPLLTLEKAMEMARNQNIDYLIQQAVTRSAQNDSRKALSSLFPQVGSSASYVQVDEDRAQGSGGSLPERETDLGAGLQQIIFNDPILSYWRSQRQVYKGRQFEEEDVQLNVTELAGKAFLDYTASVALLKVEENNLKLTQENLDLAVTRNKLGLAGPEEVFRWEAEAARAGSRVLERKSAVEQTLVALNQILGFGQDTRWQPQEIVLQEDDLYFLNNGLREIVKNYHQLEQWREFSVKQAFQNSPTLKFFEKFMVAQKITLNQKYRRFFIPEAGLTFNYDYEFDADREGPGGTPVPPPFHDDHDWTVGLKATFPVFESGGKFFDVGREKAKLLRTQRELTRSEQLLEKRVRNATYGMEQSIPNLRLTRKASVAADKNYDVVKEKYARGTLTILDLLDAQNEALNTKQNATLAVYAYLSDLVEYQRSLSWFEMDKTPDEKQLFLNELKQMVTQ